MLMDKEAKMLDHLHVGMKVAERKLANQWQSQKVFGSKA